MCMIDGMCMLANTILAVSGNKCCFCIDHRENGVVYELQPGEKYRTTICKQMKDDERKIVDSDSAQPEFDCDLEPGDYYFKIGIVKNGVEHVISPAVDKNGVRLNTLSVVRDL